MVCSNTSGARGLDKKVLLITLLGATVALGCSGDGRDPGDRGGEAGEGLDGTGAHHRAAEPHAVPPQPVPNGVMMQGFYWNVPSKNSEGSWWKHMTAHVPTLASAGIDAIWLPPPYKGLGGNQDVGYAAYDRYDLGEFNQKGTVPTRYGTVSELEDLVTALHDHGMAVYADMVMNQMMGSDANENVNANGAMRSVPSRFTFPGRGTTYSSFVWDASKLNGCKLGDTDDTWVQWHAWDFNPYLNGQAYDNLLGCEIRYSDPQNHAELVSWGKWITAKLALDGYRIDAVKHMLTSFVTGWLDSVKGGKFAVSEAWLGDINELVQYTDSLGGRTSMFDVPLHYTFAAMSAGNGAWDMRGLKFAGFTEQRGPLSVTFVDNHDTDSGVGPVASPVANLKMLAYAYILTRDKGYPCVFWRDFDEYGLGPSISQLISIRKQYAFGGSFEHDESDQDVYVYSRTGDASHAGLLLLLNDGAAQKKNVKSFFKNATLHDRTGGSTATVTTDANGNGSFPVPARSYGIWTP